MIHFQISSKTYIHITLYNIDFINIYILGKINKTKKQIFFYINIINGIFRIGINKLWINLSDSF